MANNPLPILLVVLLVSGNGGVHIPRMPQINRSTLAELETLMNNARYIINAVDKLNNMPDMKKISELVDNLPL
ncbi:MAG: hypothetical protein PUB87_02785 [Eubacteriaceae bacterium]|nr:hypothetical protein [Eubacteriaceae bacterium]